jgi:hypothetical protein
MASPISKNRFFPHIWFLVLGFSYVTWPLLQFFGSEDALVKTLSIFGAWTCFVLLIWAIGGTLGLMVLFFKKQSAPQLERIFASGILSFVVMTFSVLLSIPISGLFPEPLPLGSGIRHFDHKIWLQGTSAGVIPGNKMSEREMMLSDLIENILPGKNKVEIEKILGPSLKTSYFAGVDKDLIYYLGPERDKFINIDSEWLLLWLDKEGKFKRYKIYND